MYAREPAAVLGSPKLKSDALLSGAGQVFDLSIRCRSTNKGVSNDRGCRSTGPAHGDNRDKDEGLNPNRRQGARLRRCTLSFSKLLVRSELYSECWTVEVSVMNVVAVA